MPLVAMSSMELCSLEYVSLLRTNGDSTSSNCKGKKGVRCEPLGGGGMGDEQCESCVPVSGGRMWGNTWKWGSMTTSSYLLFSYISDVTNMFA